MGNIFAGSVEILFIQSVENKNSLRSLSQTEQTFVTIDEISHSQIDAWKYHRKHCEHQQVHIKQEYPGQGFLCVQIQCICKDIGYHQKEEQGR